MIEKICDKCKFSKELFALEDLEITDSFYVCKNLNFKRHIIQKAIAEDPKKEAPYDWGKVSFSTESINDKCMFFKEE